jgi:trk system potassium uptake protein TrkA
MAYIVVGCGRVGAEVALRLHQRGHAVAVIDQEPAAFHNLHPDFRGRLLEGDALDRSVLERAGIGEATGLAAVTNSDSLNAVISHVALQLYRVPRVLARNYDPVRRPLFDAFGLQVVSSSSWGAQRIEELLLNGGPRVIFEAGNGEVGIYELGVPAAWEGRVLQQLLQGVTARAVSLTRAGRAQLPDPSTELQAGDVLLVSATLEGIQAVQQRLAEGEGV